MTRDDDLITQLRLMSSSTSVVNESERVTIETEIAFYRTSCKLSNGRDKQRNLHWSMRAFDSKKRLELIFAKLTGRPYFDMRRFQRLDKCDCD